MGSPLDRFVEGQGAVAKMASERAYARLPDGRVELLVRVGAEVEVLAAGTRAHAFRKTVVEADESIRVRFRAAAAYPFFGVPMDALTDRFVSIERLWGRDGLELREKIGEAKAGARMALIEDALVKRMQGDVFEPSGARMVKKAVALIDGVEALPRVEGLARELGVSARQLRRTFDEVVGVSPKTYLRIARFQRALRRARVATRRDWGAIARATGYYDQAHLIAEFRDLAGVTPETLLRQGESADAEMSSTGGLAGLR